MEILNIKFTYWKIFICIKIFVNIFLDFAYWIFSEYESEFI
jgi:hypothetical protein